MTAEEAFNLKKEAAKARKDAIREQMQMNDNVNQYAVKHKLEKRKVERAKINARQIKVYDRLL